MRNLLFLFIATVLVTGCQKDKSNRELTDNDLMPNNQPGYDVTWYCIGRGPEVAETYVVASIMKNRSRIGSPLLLVIEQKNIIRDSEGPHPYGAPVYVAEYVYVTENSTRLRVDAENGALLMNFDKSYREATIYISSPRSAQTVVDCQSRRVIQGGGW